MENERRHSNRGIMLTEVKYEGAGVRSETRISDINLSGVFIDAMSPLPVGAEIKLAFTLPGGQRVDTEGVVAHSQPGIGMGVEFTGLTPEQKELIQAAIEK